MLSIDEIIRTQKDFDSRHEGNFPWNMAVTDDNMELLEFLLISLLGELGEAANIVKKIVRGDYLLSEKKELLEEEIVDMFIYIMKMIYQLDIDISKAYLKKLKKNEERFVQYETKLHENGR